MLESNASPEEPAQGTSPAGRDEVGLVRRAQMGSAAAFEQLVIERGPALYRYLVLRLRNESDARDALQETLAAAWQSLPSLKEPSRFWTWLVAIGGHKAADIARRRRPSSEQPDTVGARDEDTLEIREALGSLAPPFREVLLLRYGLELSEHEAAAVLGVRVGTVKSRSARARRALEELLDD